MDVAVIRGLISRDVSRYVFIWNPRIYEAVLVGLSALPRSFIMNAVFYMYILEEKDRHVNEQCSSLH